MTDRRRAVFRDLERDEIEALLARNHVGRIAYAFHERVDIEPMNYAYEDMWIYGRTAAGTKLAMVRHHPWIAFEVDEVEGLFDWTSVVVHGALYLLDADGAPADRDRHRHALELLRSLVPEVLTDDDPAPHRTALFRIHVDEVTGKSSSSGTV